MKSTLFLIGTALLLSGLSSCSKDDAQRDGGRDVKMIDITVRAGHDASDATRVSVGGNEVTWNAGDSFRLFDDKTALPYDWTMTLDPTGAGEVTAPFTGTIAGNPDRTMFYAFYSSDLSAVAAATDLTKVPVSVPAVQTQTAETDAAGFGQYITEVAAFPFAGDPKADNSDISVPFRLVNAAWDINISNPNGEAVTSVSIVSTDGKTPFVTAGTVNIKQAYPANGVVVTPTATSDRMEVNVPSVDVQTFTVRFALLPTVLDAADLQIVVQTAAGTDYTFTRGSISKTILSGMRYSSSVSLATTATKSVYLNQDFSGLTQGAAGGQGYPNANPATLTSHGTFESLVQIYAAQGVVGLTDWMGYQVFGAKGVAKIGTVTNRGIIQTPVLTTVQGTVSVNLNFDAAAWHAAGGQLSINVLNGGTIAGVAEYPLPTLLPDAGVSSGTGNPMQHYSFRVDGVTSATRFQFVAAAANNAFFLDNVSVTDL